MISYDTYEDLKANQTDAISDYFDNNFGIWRNYATYEVAQSNQLLKQKHTDIRTFTSDLLYIKTLKNLNDYTLSNLDTFQLKNLQGSQQTKTEIWKNGSDADLTIGKVVGAYNGINLSCSNANTEYIAKSVLQDKPINIADYSSTDKIVITLPAFDSTNIDTANSYLDVSSSSTFATDFTANLKFDDGTFVGTTNKELQFTVDKIFDAIKTDIIGIRFRIKTKSGASACNFKCIGIRCLSKDWAYAPVDINTLENKLCKTLPNYGSWATFPVGTGTNGLPSEWPILIRSFNQLFDDTSDPKIVTGTLNTFIRIGDVSTTASTNTSRNSITVYFGNRPKRASQNDLGGPAITSKTQAYLTASGKNPEFIASESEPRRQGNMSKIPSSAAAGNQIQTTVEPYPDQPGNIQADFSAIPTKATADGGHQIQPAPPFPNQVGTTQTNLNKFPSANAVEYSSISFNWYKKASTDSDYTGLININTPSNNSSTHGLYQFEIPRTVDLKNSNIVFSATVNESSVSIKIYKINNNNQMKLIYQTGEIVNDLYFNRSRGRIGWSTKLIDADSSIESIRSGGLVYAEYRTGSMRSRTPVKGVNLFADYSEDLNVATTISGFKSSTTEDDTQKFGRDLSTKVTTPAGSSFSGIVTNEFSIEDPNDMMIRLSLWCSSNVNYLRFVLIDDNDMAVADLEPEYFKYNQWSNIKVHLNKDTFICGKYRLAIVQPHAYESNTWWLSDFTIKRRLIAWESRTNNIYNSTSWVDFRNNQNKMNNGIYFEEKGIDLEVRALAKSHYGSIEKIQTLPVYATLGNFVWRDE